MKKLKEKATKFSIKYNDNENALNLDSILQYLSREINAINKIFNENID